MCSDIDVIDDDVVEENEESFTVTLSADDPSVTTVTASSATIDIRENDNDGKLKFLLFAMVLYTLMTGKNVMVKRCYYAEPHHANSMVQLEL